MSTSKSRVARMAASVAATAIAGLALAGPALADSGSPGGAFVIGDQSSLAPGGVTLWGAQWSQQNLLSGGPAPHAFKGYADNVSVSATSCGGTWTSSPGNSSAPPAPPLGGTINVIVSSAISKSGPVISGDIQAIAIVKPDPGYAADPGHPATGMIVGYLCGGPAGAPTTAGGSDGANGGGGSTNTSGGTGSTLGSPAPIPGSPGTIINV